MRRGAWLVGTVVVFGGAALLGGLWPRTSTSMPDAIRIPIVAPNPQRVPSDAALFRHGTHGQFSCYGCHPTLFPRHLAGFTHAQMKGGRLCAACHDGKVAFSITGAPCARCHVPN